MCIILIMFPLFKGCGDQAESDPPIIPSQLKCHHSQPHEFSMDPVTISLGGAFSGWWVVTRLSVSIGYCVVTALPPRLLSMGEEEAVFLLLWALFPEQCLVQRQN